MDYQDTFTVREVEFDSYNYGWKYFLYNAIGECRLIGPTGLAWQLNIGDTITVTRKNR
jgi:hypothetical protein